MKMRVIKLKPELLMKAIQGKAKSFISNLPENLELLDIKFDLFSKEVLAVVRSDNFDSAEDTYPIPEFKVTIKEKVKKEIQPKMEKKLKSKSTSTKTYSNQRSGDIRDIEEEFSPAQRELLRFTVDGDFVLVKPIQYLKDDWNEINDVVRSLGGKWIRGDFSSYWAIPLQEN
jgi:hypothetical protein